MFPGDEPLPDKEAFPGATPLPGKEHEDAVNLRRQIQQEEVDNWEVQHKALDDMKVRDDDRAKAEGDFQAKAEARARGQTMFDSNNKPKEGIDELDHDMVTPKSVKPVVPAKPVAPSPPTVK